MPRPNAQRVTLRDVAAEVGVSAKTVSNAFRRPDQLSARLRDAILSTAARLGYPGPDPLAAGFRTGRVGAVGVAYSNRLSYAFDDAVSVEMFAGITSAAEDAGAGLLLVPASAMAERRVAALSSAVVDGLIVNSLADDDPLLPVAIARKLPLAVIDQPHPPRLAELGAAGSPWIGIDDHAAAVALAEHLVALGHRRFGVVCFGLHRLPRRGLVDERVQAAASFAVSRHRLAGFRAAAQRAGLDWARVSVAQGTDSTVAEGHAAAAAVLATKPRPTALLCLSDRLAHGALRAAAQLNLRVPEELSIAGFDDAPRASELGLTTVRQPNRQKGELAMQALLRRLDGDAAEPARVLPTELVIRSSTGPPPSALDREP